VRSVLERASEDGCDKASALDILGASQDRFRRSRVLESLTSLVKKLRVDSIRARQ
jgi:hypothetical protein